MTPNKTAALKHPTNTPLPPTAKRAARPATIDETENQLKPYLTCKRTQPTLFEGLKNSKRPLLQLHVPGVKEPARKPTKEELDEKLARFLAKRSTKATPPAPPKKNNTLEIRRIAREKERRAAQSRKRNGDLLMSEGKRKAYLKNFKKYR